VPPVAAVQIVSGVAVDLDPTVTGVVCDDAGCPVALALGQPGPGPEPAGGPFERFGRLIDHFEPVVPVLAEAAGLSRKLIWANVAVMLDWIVEEIDRRALAPSDRIEAARAITREAVLPDGRRNPLCGPYRPAGSDGICRRRLCCQRLDIPGFAICPNCPDRRAGGPG